MFKESVAGKGQNGNSWRKVFYVQGDNGRLPNARPLDIIIWDGRVFTIAYDNRLVRVA